MMQDLHLRDSISLIVESHVRKIRCGGHHHVYAITADIHSRLSASEAHDSFGKYVGNCKDSSVAQRSLTAPVDSESRSSQCVFNYRLAEHFLE